MLLTARARCETRSLMQIAAKASSGILITTLYGGGDIMNGRRLLFLLTAANLMLLGYQLLQPRIAVASTRDVPEVLRARGLEIVDSRGRVRASISVLPEDPAHVWRGKPYPETVLLRLITSEGRPNVKLGASKMGSGLLIGGESDPTYVQVLAEGGQSTVKLINKDSTERVIKP